MKKDNDQLELPYLRIFCTKKGCQSEVDYNVIKLDNVHYCLEHWNEWSRENYREGSTLDQIKDVQGH